MDAGAIAGIVIAVVVVLVVGVFKFLIGWKEVRDEQWASTNHYQAATHNAMYLAPKCAQPSWMRLFGRLPVLKPHDEVLVYRGGDGVRNGTPIRGRVTSKCKNDPDYYMVKQHNGWERKYFRTHLATMVPKK
jgi:hypothetical protein